MWENRLPCIWEKQKKIIFKLTILNLIGIYSKVNKIKKKKTKRKEKEKQQ
jgi:hypothetical protein